MYHYIKGKYTERGESFAVVENGGIGYRIHTSQQALSRLSKDDEVIFYTHLNVREDAIELFGFPSAEELSMFTKLLSVSGVGPKAALAILSVASPESIALAVICDDVKTITMASGVGPKLAQRIILELKDKMKASDVANAADNVNEAFGDAASEAVSALMVLGYSALDARNAVGAAKGESVEDIVREALTRLMK